MAQELHAAITAAQTTIKLRNSIDQADLGQSGVVTIDSEKIRYDGTTDRDLLSCTRGYAGTTAATHSEGANVTSEYIISTPSTISNVVEVAETKDDSGSHQSVAADLTLGSASGSADGSDPDYLAAIMGNVLGADMASTQDANYIAGVIGAFSVTGTKRTTYPAGGVLAQITDGVTEADGAVVAYVDGDGSVTTANAAFKAMSNNSTPGSGFTYGLDLHSPAHDGYNALAILNADIRMTNQVCVLNGAGAPVDGTTGDNFAGIGSIYIDTTNGNAYLQTAVITSPVWKLITRAA